MFIDNKTLILLLCIVVMTSCLSRFFPDDPDGVPHYTISVKEGLIPFVYREKDSLVGIDIEVLNNIAQTEGFTYTLISFSVEDHINCLLDESADGAINMAFSDERDDLLDFSIPYANTKMLLVLDSANTEISTFYDIANKTVGTIKGGICENYLSENKTNLGISKIVSIDGDIMTLIKALFNNDFDCCLMGEYSFIQLRNSNIKVKALNYSPADISLCFSVKKGLHNDLLASFNKGYARIAANGVMNMIIEKYTKSKNDVDFQILTSINSYPPYLFYTGNQNVGLEIDILNAIAADQDFSFDLITCPHEEIYSSITDGKYQDKLINGAIGSLLVTEKMEQIVDFSLPFFEDKFCLVIKENNNTIKSITDLDNARIAVEADTPIEDFVMSNLTSTASIIYSLQSMENVLSFIINDKVDAGFLEQTTADYLINKGNAIKAIGQYGTIQHAFAVKKGYNQRLMTAFNLGFSHIVNNGKYHEILEQYTNLNENNH